MRSLVVPVAALLISTAAHAAVMPVGAFACQRLMAEDYAKAGPDDYLPSVLGIIRLDGKGGYEHADGNGTVALSKDLLRFMDGPAKGVIAVLRTDAKGKIYLHIDKEIIEIPKAKPEKLDVVCISPDA